MRRNAQRTPTEGCRPRNRKGAGAASILLAAVLAWVLAPGCAPDTGGAARPLTPDSLHAWMERGEPHILFDTRSRADFEDRHLPGAMSAETRSIPQLREVIPMDPDIPIVVYNEDGSVPPDRLDLADEAAETYGFPNVYRLEGGLRAWESRGYTLDGNAVLRGGGSAQEEAP